MYASAAGFPAALCALVHEHGADRLSARRTGSNARQMVYEKAALGSLIVKGTGAARRGYSIPNTEGSQLCG